MQGLSKQFLSGSLLGVGGGRGGEGGGGKVSSVGEGGFTGGVCGEWKKMFLFLNVAYILFSKHSSMTS